MIWNWVYVIAIVALNNLLLWFWKPWTQSYAQEKGKNLARAEDLDRILTEVRAVTASQKQIEAKISDQVWERQWCLNQKRDAYVGLLSAFTDLRSTYGRMVNALRVSNSDEDYGNVEAKIPDRMASIDRAVLFARLFVSQRALDAVEVYRSRKYPGERLARANAGYTIVKEVEDAIVAAARADLGLAPPEFALRAAHPA